jgi:hypothetical protein
MLCPPQELRLCEAELATLSQRLCVCDHPGAPSHVSDPALDDPALEPTPELPADHADPASDERIEAAIAEAEAQLAAQQKRSGRARGKCQPFFLGVFLGVFLGFII